MTEGFKKIRPDKIQFAEKIYKDTLKTIIQIENKRGILNDDFINKELIKLNKIKADLEKELELI